MTASQQEFDDLIESAPPGLDELLDVYESIESAYRLAVAPVECYPETTNVAMLPRAIVDASTTVR
ncbi:MAG: hypothetical protein ACYDEP_08010 [Acidimicrobiales bacterium]|jgi:hypothetical protein